MDEQNNDNVFQLGAIKGGKIDEPESGIPINDYVIVDTDREELFATGFLVFTAQHVAVMRDYGSGAVPVLVVPLNRVRFAELVEDDEVI